jgi:ABC-2 type transport system permease protein
VIRTVRRYAPFGILQVQYALAYNAWFWVELLRSVIAMLIMVAFWKAIYADQATLSGLALSSTLSYVVLARALGNANASAVYWWIAQHIGNGELELQLLRPVDFQMMHLWRDACGWGLGLLRALPALLIGVLVFGARLPTTWEAYAAFLLTFFLGAVSLYFLEFMVGCLVFYTTEVWGLSILREGIALFFSGALIPLDLLPEGFRTVATFTPFAQALYIPISFLSGVRQPDRLLEVVLLQLGTIAVLLLLSRWLFARAVKSLTVQGG